MYNIWLWTELKSESMVKYSCFRKDSLFQRELFQVSCTHFSCSSYQWHKRVAAELYFWTLRVEDGIKKTWNDVKPARLSLFCWYRISFRLDWWFFHLRKTTDTNTKSAHGCTSSGCAYWSATSQSVRQNTSKCCNREHCVGEERFVLEEPERNAPSKSLERDCSCENGKVAGAGDELGGRLEGTTEEEQIVSNFRLFLGNPQYGWMKVVEDT